MTEALGELGQMKELLLREKEVSEADLSSVKGIVEGEEIKAIYHKSQV